MADEVSGTAQCRSYETRGVLEVAWRGRLAFACLLLNLPVTAAVAQSRAVTLSPSLGVTLTSTSNASVDAQTGSTQRDVVLELNPQLYVRARTARIQADGSFGFIATDYLQGNGKNRISPSGNLGLNATLVEDTLFLDAGAAGTRTPGSIFGAEVGDTATSGAATTGSIRISPYVYREVVPDVFLLARSDNVVANTFGSGSAVDRLGDVRHRSNLLKIDRRPIPVGVSFEVSQDRTKYDSRQGTAFGLDVVRVTGTVSLEGEVLVGVIGGHERSTYFSEGVSSGRFGVMTTWRPTGRTNVEAELEHRFFGTGWRLEAQHRMPTMALELAFRRTASALPTSLGSASLSGGLTSLLDSIYRTRFPDDVERAALVQSTLQSRGLQNDLFSPGDVFTQYAQVQRDANVRVVLNGPRNLVSLSAFHSKASALVGAADEAASTRNDTRQYGVAVEVSRRMSEQTTVNTVASRRSTRGAGVGTPESSIQTSLGVGANLTISVHSSATFDVSRAVTRSTRTPPPGNETAMRASFVVRY